MRLLRDAVEMDLGELFGLAAKRWRLLVTVMILAASLALSLTFLIEPRYHSYASILPQKGFLQEREIVLSENTFDFNAKLRPVNASNSQNLVFGASFKLREAIVDSLQLISFFDFDELEAQQPERAMHEAVDKLRRITHFELSLYRDVLIIHATTKDAQMSADIANLYISLIERENHRQYNAFSNEMLTFLTDQLKDTQREIRSLVDSTTAFYQERNIVEIKSETDALFSLLKELDLQRMSLELALSRAELDASPDDPLVRRMAKELEAYDALRAEYKNIDLSSRVGASGGADLSIGTILDVKRFERQMEQLEKFETNLTMKLANTLIESKRNEVNLPIMDRAFPATEPIWPKRWLITLCTMAIATLLTYIGLFLLDTNQLRRRSA